MQHLEKTLQLLATFNAKFFSLMTADFASFFPSQVRIMICNLIYSVLILRHCKIQLVSGVSFHLS